MSVGANLKKLPKADRDLLHRAAHGGISEAEFRRYLTLDDVPQAQRDMRAVGLRLARRTIRHHDEIMLMAIARQPAPR